MEQLHQHILNAYKVLQPYVPLAYEKSVRIFLKNPSNVPFIIGTLIVGILLPFLLSYVYCNDRKRGKGKTRSIANLLPSSAIKVQFDNENQPIIPSTSSSSSKYGKTTDYVLICTQCKIDVHPQRVSEHTKTKDHSQAVWFWMNEKDGQKYIGKPCTQHRRVYKKKKNADDNDEENNEDSEDDEIDYANNRNSMIHDNSNDTLRIQGKGVIVVGSTHTPPTTTTPSSGVLDMMNPSMEEGWTTIQGGNHQPSQNAHHPVSTAKKQGNILSNLLYMEGGSNILQGFFTYDNFIQPNAETLLLSWVYENIRLGQTGRLRGSTYTSGKDTFPSMLQYGSYYDWYTANPITSKLVEPIPTQINDFCRKIAAKLKVLGGPPLNHASSTGKVGKENPNFVPPPDSVSIYILRKGQYLPPHLLSSTFFGRPYCLLTLGNEEEEDYLIGLRITPLNDNGEYASGYSYRLKRRCLLTFRDLVSQRTQQCVPAIRSNECIVIVFRYMSSALYGEMQARGNVM